MAGFVVVGDFLCWSYPEEKVVHILDMKKMNKIKVQKATRSNLANQAMTGFSNLAKAPSSLFSARNDDDNF